MIEIFEELFDLAAQYALLHVAIWGVIGCLLAGLASAVIWLMRGDMLRMMPGVLVVFVVPLMVFDILPGAGTLGAPLALISAATICLSHARRWLSAEYQMADVVLALISGISLCAIATPLLYKLFLGGAG